jgi:hypothetical protein
MAVRSAHRSASSIMVGIEGQSRLARLRPSSAFGGPGDSLFAPCSSRPRSYPMSRLMIGLVLTNVLLIPSRWPSPADPTAKSAAAANDIFSEDCNRDKTGTNSDTQKTFGSQMVSTKPLTSRVSFEAEGMGLEPTTPCGAPHFQCGR